MCVCARASADKRTSKGQNEKQRHNVQQTVAPEETRQKGQEGVDNGETNLAGSRTLVCTFVCSFFPCTLVFAQRSFTLDVTTGEEEGTKG